ncbi:TPA: calcium-binding protein [Yersinia enterocolitica]|nr:calcium-binding protein [Yersinia enterocolitica]MBX9479647.1 calcium-binding protein [Yersinia enterocolitica]HDL6737919.1 calcium-binding protein [Yersinia enterocolitica]HDW8049511.1 calcium-binding protein [Yersinia enterocolitica]HEB0975094.1 calcium-binding protein [Yersinia enterocolitica]
MTLPQHKISNKNKRKSTIGEIFEIYNGETKSIAISGISLKRIFFQNSKSGFKVNILNNKNKIINRKIYKIIENEKLTIKSIIIHDKENAKHELFLALKEDKRKGKSYDGLSKELLLTRKDLKCTSAYHLIQNTTPSEKFHLSKNDSFIGNKCIKNNVIGGSGNNLITGSDKNDNLAGGDGNDVIIGHRSFDAIFGQAGNDILIGGEGDDGLAGGAGNDILDGGDGDDELHGDADGFGPYACESNWRGNDIIFGGRGDDRIEGGKNNDYLAGGVGNDRYIFSAYDGINMIVEYSGEENTVSIADYFFHQLKFERYGNHLVISSKEQHANNLVIVIKDQYSEDGCKVKNLQTKSYLRYGSESDKASYKIVVKNIAMNHAQNHEKLVKEFSQISDFGDHYQVDLSTIFCAKMPDTEQITERTLREVLIEKNNALCEMYAENTLHFSENLPDISPIIHALSSFAPKEASQANIKYLNSPIDNFANSFITAKN